MKRQIYDLTDEPFAVFVNRVGTVLQGEKIPFYIGGGVAVQSYVLDMLSQKYSHDILGLVHDPLLRIQDYIRSTDDVDVALQLPDTGESERIMKVTSIVPKFAFEEIPPSSDYVLEVRSARTGASRPTYRLYKDGKGSEEEVIAMNIFRSQVEGLRGLDEKWYSHFIDQSRNLKVPYSSKYELSIRVPKLEHLLAMKISNSRAKDLMDNKNLTDLLKNQLKSLDFEEMERILLPQHQNNYNHFLNLHYPHLL
ncbi:hypothetical protein KW805_01945 [Candidatus Pacearchaeota archaeon]|nr:hypothetical protein [Candidatus Pacearchaeota archaeon]